MQDSWLSMVGSLTSVVAALWSFREARRSIEGATKAENMRDQIIARRVVGETSQLHAESIRILSIVVKVGPTCLEKNLRGVKTDEIAKNVQEYSSFVNERRGHFDYLFQNAATVLCDNLKEPIELLANAKEFEDKKKNGREIYHLINAFLPIVKQMADDKRELITVDD